MPDLLLRDATEADTALILKFIIDLAVYEKLEHTVVATEDSVRATLFGPRKYAEVILAEWKGKPAGFALYFHNYSTFLSKPGVYLEDLFVEPELRGNGIGKALLIQVVTFMWNANYFIVNKEASDKELNTTLTAGMEIFDNLILILILN